MTESMAAAAYDGSEIAIIDMSCRVPGAADVAAFWRNLCAGVESLVELSDEELLAAIVPAEVLSHPSYVRRVPAIAGIEDFDARFFGYTPLEAAIMDPQQRLFDFFAAGGQSLLATQVVTRVPIYRTHSS